MKTREGQIAVGGWRVFRPRAHRPDAGQMSGGNCPLEAGLWDAIAAVQTPGAPLLTIFRTSTNTVAVSWPSPLTGCDLQQNTKSVSSVNWSNVAATIQDDDPTRSLVVNPPPATGSTG
jgi:hypothetical protein